MDVVPIRSIGPGTGGSEWGTNNLSSIISSHSPLNKATCHGRSVYIHINHSLIIYQFYSKLLNSQRGAKFNMSASL